MEGHRFYDEMRLGLTLNREKHKVRVLTIT